MLIQDILTKHKDNNKVAIKYGEEKITYNQLFDEAKRWADQVKKKGLYSKNIGIFLPNSIQYAITYFAITLSNSVIVPISIHAKKAEVESTLEYCELYIVFTNSQFINILVDFLKDTKNKVTVINLDDGTFLDLGSEQENSTTTRMTDKSMNEEDVAIMLHTSGTTSHPKRVMLTHKNIITNIRSNIKSLQLTEDDVVLIALPMFFGYCNTAQFLTHLFLGATMVIFESMFMPNKFFQLVQNEKATNFTGVPSMLLMLLNYKNHHKYNISTLRYICFGGGNMPVEKLKQLIHTFETVGFVQTYGQTEASPRVTALLPEDSLRKVGSVGKPIPNVMVRIVAENGDDVKIGDSGEIIVQGDNVTKGYYKRPDETKKILRDGWLYTGDLGRFDEEGYIYLTGRKKNMIISGGHNIYPEEIEELLMCHPAVKEVCVIGEEHDLMGEVPVAKIVLRDDAVEINTGEIINYCIEHLANYKIPARVEFVEELQKTVTGKIRRY